MWGEVLCACEWGEMMCDLHVEGEDWSENLRWLSVSEGMREAATYVHDLPSAPFLKMGKHSVLFLGQCTVL